MGSPEPGTKHKTQPRWDGISDFPICCGQRVSLRPQPVDLLLVFCFSFNNAFFCLQGFLLMKKETVFIMNRQAM